MKYIHITCLLSISFALCGCNKPIACTPDSMASNLKSFVVSHAASDASEALSNGDRRLLGVTGVGLEVPGFSQNPDSYLYGVKMVKGTSDVACSQDNLQLNRNAWLYAKQYNEQMILLTNIKR